MLMAELTGISQVVEGDLVYKTGSSLGEAITTDTFDDDDSHINSPEMEMSCETLTEEMIQSVKVCYRKSLLIILLMAYLCITLI
jgi:tRNA pseudouridine13 synthase